MRSYVREGIINISTLPWSNQANWAIFINAQILLGECSLKLLQYVFFRQMCLLRELLLLRYTTEVIWCAVNDLEIVVKFSNTWDELGPPMSSSIPSAKMFFQSDDEIKQTIVFYEPIHSKRCSLWRSGNQKCLRKEERNVLLSAGLKLGSSSPRVMNQFLRKSF